LLGPVLQVLLDILSSLNRFGKSLNVLQYLEELIAEKSELE